MLIRSLNSPASNPASASTDRSGRSGAPVPASTAPPTSCRSTRTGRASKKTAASRKSGIWPATPIAVRNRNELRTDVFGNHGSSPMTHDRLPDGYVVEGVGSSRIPVASCRRVPVRKIRSLRENSCWPYTATVGWSVFASVVVNCDVSPARLVVGRRVPHRSTETPWSIDRCTARRPWTWPRSVSTARNSLSQSRSSCTSTPVSDRR